MALVGVPVYLSMLGSNLAGDNRVIIYILVHHRNFLARQIDSGQSVSLQKLYIGLRDLCRYLIFSIPREHFNCL